MLAQQITRHAERSLAARPISVLAFSLCVIPAANPCVNSIRLIKANNVFSLAHVARLRQAPRLGPLQFVRLRGHDVTYGMLNESQSLRLLPTTLRPIAV